MARELAIENGKLKSDLDANGKMIVNLAAPVSDNDAATKKYVDERPTPPPSWSDITGKPTTFPPEAHTHTNDSWFTTALEAVKVWAKALLPSWLTPDYVEPATVASVETKVNRSGDTMTGKLIVSAGTDSDTGFRAQLNASNWAELKASKIHVKRGANAATRVLSFPDSSGTFALTSDIADPVEVIDPASATEAGKAADALATKNALGRKLDVDGPTVESGMTVKGSIYSTGLYTRYDEGSTSSTKYAPEHIENGEAVILLPSSSGTLALTSDIPVKISDMRDENGNPTTKTAMKLGADGSLKINYRSGTEYHGLELTGLSDDFYAYDEYNGGHLPDPYIGKWKGPFNVGGQAGNVFVPENQPDPKTEEEALQGWVVWYQGLPDSAQLMYKTGAITQGFSLNADTIDAQGTGKTETWSPMYIIGHVYFTREQGTVHERTMTDLESVATMIRTAVADFDPDEQSFADLVNILKNIGA